MRKRVFIISFLLVLISLILIPILLHKKNHEFLIQDGYKYYKSPCGWYRVIAYGISEEENLCVHITHLDPVNSPLFASLTYDNSKKIYSVSWNELTRIKDSNIPVQQKGNSITLYLPRKVIDGRSSIELPGGFKIGAWSIHSSQ